MDDDFSLMRWCGKLGGIRQFRDVEYVSHQGNTVACALCGTGWMNRDQRIHHFHGGRHEMRYNAVQNLEASINRSKEIAQRFDQVGTMRYEASRLKLDRWKHHVGSLLLEHVEGKPNILATAKRQIDVYKLMETTSLLELACCKFHILSTGIFSSLEEVREYISLDQRFDYMRFMQEKRVQSGAQIIIPNVLAFLPKTCLQREVAGFM